MNLLPLVFLAFFLVSSLRAEAPAAPLPPPVTPSAAAVPASSPPQAELEAEVPFTPNPFGPKAPRVKVEEIASEPEPTVAQIPPAERLERAYHRFERIAREGGWPRVPPGPILRAGDWDKRVIALRKRLKITGELTETHAPIKEVFDGDVDEAVAYFQSNNGIEPTGELDAATVDALNVPVAARLATLRANLQRWQSHPRLSPNDRYILVDIAGFQVRLYEKGAPVLGMRAVVGERGKETPIFQSRVTQVVLNPWWSMPRNIAVTEALPELQRDPSQFGRNHVEVIDEIHGKRVNPRKINWKRVSPRKFYYSFRQAPGPDNPLGTMKFTLPNPYSVYIHGTPEHWLFQSPNRTFSHGCVRLEKPMELAVALLKDTSGGWSGEKLEELIKTGKTRTVEITKPLPIYFGYWTAWVDEWDALQFRRDVYGWDRVDPASFAAAPDLTLPPPLLADGLNGLELDNSGMEDGAGEPSEIAPILAE